MNLRQSIVARWANGGALHFHEMNRSQQRVKEVNVYYNVYLHPKISDDNIRLGVFRSVENILWPNILRISFGEKK